MHHLTPRVPPPKKSRSPCKWCGSTTHKTARSLNCPKNPKYRGPSTTGEEPAFFPIYIPNQTGIGVGGYFSPIINPPTTDLRPSPVLLDSSTNVPKDTIPSAKTDSTNVPKDTIPSAKRDNPDDNDETPRQEYDLGSNVLARWKRNSWFLAHITRFNNGKYDVYFPGDGEVKLGLHPSSIQPCSFPVPEPTRGSMIDKEFFYDGDDELSPSLWKVRRIEGNEYWCVKIRGPGTKNCVNFDIGYVIRAVQQQHQHQQQQY